MDFKNGIHCVLINNPMSLHIVLINKNDFKTETINSIDSIELANLIMKYLDQI